ncbi:rhodopsin, GQ-coupled-like, partial [Stegodyphus dumicola]|uniref:rhodopsin, GQ-coupled-like n=1 Tax=Stegodyphus dumicola TaxID=202533 RepID=UPI0015B3330C
RVFSLRYRRLRSPANTLIVNLAVSDVLNGFLHPMATYSSFKEVWMFGKLGCEIYASLCGLFGLVSIATLTAIAIERCLVISVKPWYGGILFTNAKAKVAIIFIWIYCLAIMLPPLFGWGALVPEGFLTSCSFDYLSRTSLNRSYFIYIFIFGFFLPITIITICYAFIIRTIYLNEKDMKKNNVKKIYTKPKKRNDYKAAEMIMFVIAMFLLSWTPYSLVAIIGQFGNTRILTPWVSVLPSLFAKMSTIYNPAIYGLSHRHFRATLRRIFKKKLQRSSIERGGTYLSKNSSVIRTRNGCPCLPNYDASEVIEDSSSSFTGKKVYVGVTVANEYENCKIIYIKREQDVADDLQFSCECDTCNMRNRRFQNSLKSLRSHDCCSIVDDSPPRRSDGPTTVAVPESAKPTMVMPEIIAPENKSLLRSLMFRSESSLHQKYQTYMEDDHIVKIPTVVYFYNNPFSKSSKCETVSASRAQLSTHVPNACVDLLPATEISTKVSSKRLLDVRNQKLLLQKCENCHTHLCTNSILIDKFSH